MWLKLYLGAVAMVVLGVVPVLARNRMMTTLEINHSSGRYRICSHVLGLQRGQWKKLPLVQRVVVRYFSEYVAASSDYQEGDFQQAREYILLFSVPDSPTGVILYRHPVREQAVAIACQIGDALGVEVVEFNQYQQVSVVQDAPPPAHQ
ncbi:hypothetical protein [Hymenobacter weizhouensis]|uniref:hypothetical protein n=1 Tax=Hymenobacter sp. YIM 151500-1 TaxID=2987689 RepID=UPI002227A54E|nr:hypothetical protein [Hymenobacter sp. YIM 151500-1]UYZ63612.1 hypothetical protein OIS53_01915 [Hymenobacter sp. YIM 151500-1]